MNNHLFSFLAFSLSEHFPFQICGTESESVTAGMAHLSAHHIHITAMIAITTAPDAMNTASDCQKEKFPP
jgi:hypothetical protein